MWVERRVGGNTSPSGGLLHQGPEGEAGLRVPLCWKHGDRKTVFGVTDLRKIAKLRTYCMVVLPNGLHASTTCNVKREHADKQAHDGDGDPHPRSQTAIPGWAASDCPTSRCKEKWRGDQMQSPLEYEFEIKSPRYGCNAKARQDFGSQVVYVLPAERYDVWPIAAKSLKRIVVWANPEMSFAEYTMASTLLETWFLTPPPGCSNRSKCTAWPDVCRRRKRVGIVIFVLPARSVPSH
eukprot:gene30109-36366_t